MPRCAERVPEPWVDLSFPVNGFSCSDVHLVLRYLALFRAFSTSFIGVGGKKVKSSSLEGGNLG